MKKDKNKTYDKMPKYHPDLAIIALLIIGIGALAVCITVGIIITQLLGSFLVKKVGCNAVSYSTDFLGGALGLTVGFALDKFCIERINQVSKYKKLMKAVKDELESIKMVSYKKGDDTLYIKNYGKNLILYNKADKKVWSVEELEKIEDLIDNEKVTEKDLNDIVDFFDEYETDGIREFILDDLVQNADTTAIIITLPFGRKYKKELVDQLGYTQNYIEQFNEAEKNTLKENVKWMLLQYYINNVIKMTGVRK